MVRLCLFYHSFGMVHLLYWLMFIFKNVVFCLLTKSLTRLTADNNFRLKIVIHFGGVVLRTCYNELSNFASYIKNKALSTLQHSFLQLFAHFSPTAFIVCVPPCNTNNFIKEDGTSVNCKSGKSKHFKKDFLEFNVQCLRSVW